MRQKNQGIVFQSKRLLCFILSFAVLIQLFVIPAYAAYKEEDIINGWRVIIKEADSRATIDTNEAYEGSASLKLENRTGFFHDRYISVSYNSLPVKKGHTYHYGFAVKAENATNATACINWNVGKQSILPFGSSSDWREIGFSYTHNTDAATVDLRILLENKGILWLDKAYFYDEAEGKDNNMILTPSFEGGKTGAEVSTLQTEIKTENVSVIPAQYKENVNIDGNSNDWADIEAMPITTFREFAAGEKDLKASIRYAYDDINFYFLLEVEDDIHHAILESNYWTADSVQFALCNEDERYGAGYGVAYDEKANSTVVFGSDAISAKAAKKENLLTYEVAIPWTLRSGGVIPEMFKFNAIINDNDGAERKNCLEIAPGIADKKDGTLYPRILPITNGGYSVWFEGNENVSVNQKATYTLTIINGMDTSQEFTILSNFDKKETKVTLEAGEKGLYTFEKKYSEIGPKTESISILNGKEKVEKTSEIDVLADADLTHKLVNKHKKNLSELTEILTECTNKDIPIEYEKINYYVIERFIPYFEEDANNGIFDRIYYMDIALDELYLEAKNNMLAYLNGEKEPTLAPQYVTSPITMEGKHFVADTKTTTKDGEVIERRPVFFVGAGHWPEAAVDIPEYNKFGFNATHFDMESWKMFDKADLMESWELHTMGERQIHYYTSTDEKRNGNYSLGIDTDQPKSGAWNNYNLISQIVKVEPNTTYEYGLSAKTKNATGWPMFSVDGFVKYKHSFEGTHDWKDYAFKYKTGEKQTELEFSISIDSPADAIYLDDCFVKKEGTDENLLKDPGFEELKPDMDSEKMEEGIHYQAFPDKINKIEECLKLCEENNIAAVYMLDLHNISEYMYYEDPSINNDFGKFWNGFVDFNPTHPERVRFQDISLQTVLPRIKDYKSLALMMMTNEPVFVSYISSQYYLPIYQKYLNEKYKTIDNLNKTWGTNYENFSQAEMPTKVEGTAKFTDWRIFNDSIMYDYQKQLAETAKQVAPNVKVGSKFMQPITKYGTGRVEGGSTNLAPLTELMDLNAVDGWAYFDTSDRDVISKMAYYDLVTSFKDAPIFNGEDHIIEDKTAITYSDDELKFNLTDIWQGAIRGRGGSILWLWDEIGKTKNNNMYLNASLTLRPKHVAEIGKMTLDLNRLSKDIVAIQDEEPTVAILYSLHSFAWNPAYLNTLYHAYAAAGNSGQKVFFVDESRLEELDKFDVLVIPGAEAVEKETVEAIDKFASRGGNILIVNKDSLSSDGYGVEHKQELVKQIFDKATVVDVEEEGNLVKKESVEDIYQAMRTVVKAAGYYNIEIKDVSTGKALANSEWLSAEKDGKILINLCMYDYGKKEVEVLINGKKATEIEDLKGQQKFTDQVTLDGYVPMFLEIKK